MRKKTVFWTHNRIFLCRLAIGFVFAFAGMMKALDPAGMKEAVEAYNAMPDSLVPLVAVTLPWVELLCGLMLVFNVFSRSAALVIALSLAGFMYGVGLNMWRGVEMECGCFDVIFRQTIGWGVMARDVGFLLLSLPPLLYGDNGFLSYKLVISRNNRP